MNDLEHPDITRCNRAGYPRKLEVYRCPKCLQELDPDEKIYKNEDGEVVGCDECLQTVEASEYIEES